MIKREDIVGFRILVDELGLVDALRIGGRTQRRLLGGEPFDHLDAPHNDDERQSREQIGPAIVLYRQLRREYGEDRALAVIERVIIEASVVFLSKTVGRLRRDDLLAMGDDEREAFVRQKGRHFANATLTWDHIGAESVEFTVTHCRFPPLCEKAGVPELAPLFCRGDAEFFGGVEQDVDLERPHTIAEGAETCPFHIYSRVE